MLEGMLLIDKPQGVTSHDVVQIVRRKLGIRRVGHTGTLDPMAQGLLILLIGPSTTHQQAFQTHEKTYEALLQLGTQTDTGDAMGVPIRTAPVPALDRAHVADLLASFQGRIEQIPPAYSAVKVRGRPAYWWVRRGQSVALSPRTVRLFEVAFLSSEQETIAFWVRCSAGTYIRTLAESIAERLGTVGHLTKLKRLRVGDWNLEDAKPLAWVTQTSVEGVASALQPVPRASTPLGTSPERNRGTR